MNSAETPIMFDFDIVECFPEEICINFFSYLSFDELLSASLVSKDWYNLIGRAPEIMKKIILKLSFDDEYLYGKQWNPVEFKEVLKSSTRKYENVQIDHLPPRWGRGPSKSRDVKAILEIRSRNWKKVEILRSSFESHSCLIELLTCIDQTVVELTMTGVDVDHDNDVESCELTLPKLKILAIKKENDDRFEISNVQNDFANCTKLNELELNYSAYGATDNANAVMVHKMLMRNRDLKKLTIETDFEADYLNIDISEGIQCHLTSLSISCLKLNANQTTNLQKFLQSQLESLKILSLSFWPGLKATKMIFHMPKLTQLKLTTSNCGEDDIALNTTAFHRNMTVTCFDLKVSVRRNQVDVLRVFIPLMPNLKQLNLLSVNDVILDLIAANLPNLETLDFVVHDED